ncbi:hypothetical protein LOK49_LG15G00946 [Camellia lanceoleosa]|uniref:Uncharacterized protein n=1 Tax=Camellia lanceoleosa TaxID=1840588 RepID=A0ACC0F579_9ERIC|nr:hypothetical protein LOK49_LG15G00946 [Camellia lanceoleosa]
MGRHFKRRLRRRRPRGQEVATLKVKAPRNNRIGNIYYYGFALNFSYFV